MIEKIKELTKDTAVYGISHIIGRFFNFLLVPFYTNVFDKAQFGDFSLIYAYLSFFNVLFIYGMDAAFLKYTSLSEGEGKRDTFSTPLIFVTLTSIILTSVLFLFRDEFGNATNIPTDYTFILNYVFLILILDTIALIPFANLRLERKTKKFAVIKLLNILINLSMNIVLIVGFDQGIEAIFISNLIASAFSLIALSPEIVKRLKFRIQTPVLKKMLKFAIPYLPGSLAAMFVQLIDVPILRALTNEETLGVYRANYKLGLLMMLFVSMFNYAWQPFFLNNAKDENAKQIFAKVLTLFLLVCAAIWIVLSLFVSDFAQIEFWGNRTIIGREFLGGLSIIPIILLAYLFNGFYVNFTAGIYIQEKTIYFPVITGIAAVANVISNLLLIPIYGIMGAAVSTLLSYVLMAVGLFIVSQKYYKINYEYRKILTIIFVILASLVLYYYLLSNDLLNLTVKFIFLFGFFASLVILRVVNLAEVRKTINLMIQRKV